MSRHFVHLTAGRVLALKVGGGTPRLVRIDAARAQGDGVRSFWLADGVPSIYVEPF